MSSECHTCQVDLKIFLSINPDSTANRLPQHLTTAMWVYLTCTGNTHEGRVTQRSLDLILSCAACMGELCMITASRSEDLVVDVLCKNHLRPKLCNLAYPRTFEAVLSRATTAALPRSMDGPAEFPSVNLRLCHCLMRPLYAAIYLNNAQMLSTLLSYGAEVRPEDTCRCEEPHRVHPLLKVYETLQGRSGDIPADAVRCHQLAALVVPRHDAELREACYTFAKALAPPSEHQTLLREKGSLQHLCRLTLRAALSRRRAMPKGVEQLPLPKQLQRYILYQYGPGSV